ncbi:hypothetical protein EI94DRAFT_1754902 [Lactarius quietus]|nr:hypothetical protein EI94DRAFT_1754902 [Lactarius quietus]
MGEHPCGWFDSESKQFIQFHPVFRPGSRSPFSRNCAGWALGCLQHSTFFIYFDSPDSLTVCLDHFPVSTDHLHKTLKPINAYHCLSRCVIPPNTYTLTVLMIRSCGSPSPRLNGTYIKEPPMRARSQAAPPLSPTLLSGCIPQDHYSKCATVTINRARS